MTAREELGAEVQAVQDWIDDLMRRLGWHDRERVYLSLLATVRALRDCLGREQAIYLGAQLPPLLRGLYYEPRRFSLNVSTMVSIGLVAWASVPMSSGCPSHPWKPAERRREWI